MSTLKNFYQDHLVGLSGIKPQKSNETRFPPIILRINRNDHVKRTFFSFSGFTAIKKKAESSVLQIGPCFEFTESEKNLSVKMAYHKENTLILFLFPICF